MPPKKDLKLSMGNSLPPPSVAKALAGGQEVKAIRTIEEYCSRAVDIPLGCSV